MIFNLLNILIYKKYDKKILILLFSLNYCTQLLFTTLKNRKMRKLLSLCAVMAKLEFLFLTNVSRIGEAIDYVKKQKIGILIILILIKYKCSTRNKNK